MAGRRLRPRAMAWTLGGRPPGPASRAARRLCVKGLTLIPDSARKPHACNARPSPRPPCRWLLPSRLGCRLRRSEPTPARPRHSCRRQPATARRSPPPRGRATPKPGAPLEGRERTRREARQGPRAGAQTTSSAPRTPRHPRRRQGHRRRQVSKGMELQGQGHEPGRPASSSTGIELRAGYGTADELPRLSSTTIRLGPIASLLIARMEEALFTQGGIGGSDQGALQGHAAGDRRRLCGARLRLSHRRQRGRRQNTTPPKPGASTTCPPRSRPAFSIASASSCEPADHKWRFDRLLIDDIRWRDERNARAAIARRVVPLLSADEQKKAPGAPRAA